MCGRALSTKLQQITHQTATNANVTTDPVVAVYLPVTLRDGVGGLGRSTSSNQPLDSSCARLTTLPMRSSGGKRLRWEAIPPRFLLTMTACPAFSTWLISARSSGGKSLETAPASIPIGMSGMYSASAPVTGWRRTCSSAVVLCRCLRHTFQSSEEIESAFPCRPRFRIT